VIILPEGNTVKRGFSGVSIRVERARAFVVEEKREAPQKYPWMGD